MKMAVGIVADRFCDYFNFSFSLLLTLLTAKNTVSHIAKYSRIKQRVNTAMNPVFSGFTHKVTIGFREYRIWNNCRMKLRRKGRKLQG